MTTEHLFTPVAKARLADAVGWTVNEDGCLLDHDRQPLSDLNAVHVLGMILQLNPPGVDRIYSACHEKRGEYQHFATAQAAINALEKPQVEPAE